MSNVDRLPAVHENHDRHVVAAAAGAAGGAIMIAADLTTAVCELLRGSRLSWQNETQLQEELSALLTGAGFPHEREVTLTGPQQTGTGRIDFLLPAGVGLEVKVKGSIAAVTRQLQRYARTPEVSALILATTRPTHTAVPSTVASIPVHVHVIQEGAW